MLNTTPETISLFAVLLFIATISVLAVLKSPESSQGRFVWALVIGGALIQLAFDRKNFPLLMKEDGLVEWATFFVFLVAGIAFVKRAWQQRASAGLIQVMALALVGAFCFFVAGEEISWAQRLFGFKPPEIFLEHNFQQEANVHNFFKGKSIAGFSLDSRNIVAVIACMFGVLLPLMGKLFPKVVRPFDSIVPDWRFMGFFLLVAWAEWVYPITYTGEAAEFYLGCLFLLSRNSPPQRRDHFIMAGIFLLGIGTAPAANWAFYGSSEANIAIVKKELKQISADLLQPDTLKKKLFKKRSIHKRIFTAEKAGYFKFNTDNTFLGGQNSALNENGRKDRLGFYLDPWNNPYWIKWDKRKRQLALYSFGPNRSRDSRFEPKVKIRPDDIALVFRVPVKYLQQK